MTDQYVQKKNYQTTHLDGEYIILNTENYTVTKLNEVGGFCWTLLSENQTVESIIQAIKREYALTEKINQQEIEHFLSELIQCGLVDYVD